MKGMRDLVLKTWLKIVIASRAMNLAGLNLVVQYANFFT